MPKRTAPPVLKTVRVLTEEETGLSPELVAERTPFVLLNARDHGQYSGIPSLDRASPYFLGWVRLCIGLKNSSSQRRQRLWTHREDWVWPVAQLELAKASMAAEGALKQNSPHKRPGAAHLVAIAIVSVTVQRLTEAEPHAPSAQNAQWLRPVGPKALAGLQWLVTTGVLDTSIGDKGSDLTLEVGDSVFLVKNYVRPPKRRSPSGPALEPSGALTEGRSVGVQGSLEAERVRKARAMARGWNLTVI